jgi:hypothetical protein
MKTPSRSARVKAVAKQTGKGVRTIWRWAHQGCDLNNPASINEYLEGNKLRQHANLIRKVKDASQTEAIDSATLDLNLIELGPVGPKGAARQPCSDWKRSRSDRTASYCRLSKMETRIKSRRPRSFICDRAKPFGGWMPQLKANAGTQRNRFRKSRLRLFVSILRNGCGSVLHSFYPLNPDR